MGHNIDRSRGLSTLELFFPLLQSASEFFLLKFLLTEILLRELYSIFGESESKQNRESELAGT